MYGVPSERQIEQRIQTDAALRWYLGLDLLERVPDHSTISQLRRRKPGFRKVFRRLFEEVVRQCMERDLVSGRLAATDSTHVKANASRESEYLAEVPEEPGVYWERLDAYEEEGLEELARRTGRRRKKRTNYDFPLVHRVLEEHGIDFFVRPQPVHDRTVAELKWDAFSYDETQDVYLCPNGKHLKLHSLHRSASGLYWVYLADKQDCRSCPLRKSVCVKRTSEAPGNWNTAILLQPGSGIWPDGMTPITRRR